MSIKDLKLTKCCPACFAHAIHRHLRCNVCNGNGFIMIEKKKMIGEVKEKIK